MRAREARAAERAAERSTTGLSTIQGAAVAGVSEQRVWRWCVGDHIGRKIGGRWLVDPERLRRRAEAYFAGRVYDPEDEPG